MALGLRLSFAASNRHGSKAVVSKVEAVEAQEALGTQSVRGSWHSGVWRDQTCTSTIFRCAGSRRTTRMASVV
eukprot:6777311-Prymnesium_polylepis.2